MTPRQTHDNVHNSTRPVHTPRLRLKPKGSQRGYVDGAWWPHSDVLTAELPDLLAVLSVRLGRIDRVMYNLNGWATAPKKLVTEGRAVHLDGYRRQPINTIDILGLDRSRLTLLVVPPRADPDDAYTTMMTAAQPNNVGTVNGLLVISSHTADRRTLAAAARESWESEGGARDPHVEFDDSVGR